MHEAEAMDTLIASSLLTLVLTALALALRRLISARRRASTSPSPALLPRAEEPGPTFIRRPATVAPATHSLALRPWSVPPPALGTTGCAEVQEVDLLLSDEADALQLDFWPQAEDDHRHQPASLA